MLSHREPLFKTTFQSSIKESSGGPHFSSFLENQLRGDGSASGPRLVVVQVVLLLD